MLIRSRKGLFILAAIFCALVIGAILVGVSDNVPGIVLLYLAITVPFIALTRNWQSVKRFLILLGTSFVGFFVFVLLHNVIYGLVYVEMLNRPDLDEPFFFIMAIFVCPIGFLVGAVGSIFLTIKSKQARHSRLDHLKGEKP